VEEEEMATKQSNDPRDHIRLRFAAGMKAELRLLGESGALLTRSSSIVLLLNISPEGLCFLSGLQLPVQSNYWAEFRIQLSKVQIIVRGRIVWQQKNDNLFKHGVKLESSETLRSLMIGALNEELLVREPRRQKIHQLYNRLLRRNDLYYDSRQGGQL
jgi:hypothetical protein